jgi:hypothetical protein
MLRDMLTSTSSNTKKIRSAEPGADLADDHPSSPVARLRALLRRRLPRALQSLGSYLMMVGEVMQLTIDRQEVLRRIQRRMRGEGLVYGRDDARAHAIAADEMARYRAEPRIDAMKFEISSSDAIDPWVGYDAAERER